jgi:hypothetical protein
MLTTRFRETRDLWGPLDQRGGLALSRGPLISVEQVSIADSARSFTPLDSSFYAPSPVPGRPPSAPPAWR